MKGAFRSAPLTVVLDEDMRDGNGISSTQNESMTAVELDSKLQLIETLKGQLEEKNKLLQDGVNQSVIWESEKTRLSGELFKSQEESLKQNNQSQKMIAVLIKLCQQAPILTAQLANIINQTEAAALGIGNDVQNIYQAAEHHSEDIRDLAKTYSGESNADDNEILIGVEKLAKAIEAFNSRTLYNQKLEEAVKNLVGSTENVRELAKEIDDISDQTNMLAINAAIEAAHAGQAGASFAIVAQEVRKLSGKSVQTGKNISSLAVAIEHDLTLLKHNLASAVKNDQEEIQEGRKVIVSIRARINANMSETADRLVMIQKDDQNIRNQVSKAMVSLQFQDFTRQEIEHVIDPLNDMQIISKNVLIDFDSFPHQIVTEALKTQYTVEIERQIHQMVSEGDNTSKLTKKLNHSFLEGVQGNKKEDDLSDNFTLF
jgi:methyl-accepting chemotaxis protein